jgi:hypothetical protein
LNVIKCQKEIRKNLIVLNNKLRVANKFLVKSNFLKIRVLQERQPAQLISEVRGEPARRIGSARTGRARENDGVRRRTEWRVGSGGEEGSGTRVSVLQKYVGLVDKIRRAMGRKRARGPTSSITTDG